MNTQTSTNLTPPSIDANLIQQLYVNKRKYEDKL